MSLWLIRKSLNLGKKPYELLMNWIPRHAFHFCVYMCVPLFHIFIADECQFFYLSQFFFLSLEEYVSCIACCSMEQCEMLNITTSKCFFFNLLLDYCLPDASAFQLWLLSSFAICIEYVCLYVSVSVSHTQYLCVCCCCHCCCSCCNISFRV